MDYSELYSKIQDVGGNTWAIIDSGKYKSLSIPLYINYKARESLKNRRIIFISIISSIIILFIILILYLLNFISQLSSNIQPQ